MSTWLKYDDTEVPLGYTTYQAIAALKATLTSVSWQIIQESAPITAYLGTMTTPSNAFDCSPSTNTTSSAALPLQLGVQVPTAFTATKLTIIGPATANQAPKDFTIEYSDNGSSWTTVATLTNVTGWVGYERRVYSWTAAGAHTYWRLNVSARNGGASLTIIDLIFENASGVTLSGIASMTVIPPATETIGSAKARDAVRFEINALGTLMQIIPVMHMLQDHPQILQMWDKTAGAVAAGCTINGVTVTGATGSAGSTAIQNLKALYDAIRASADPNYTAFKWRFQSPSPQNANEAFALIYGEQITPGAGATFSVNADTNGFMIGTYQPAGITPPTGAPAVAGLQLTIDLASGFIPFWQVCSRGFALGIKTPANYYGPIHACWADNAKAVASTPPAGGVHVTPIELVVGFDAASTSLDATAYAGHGWSLAATKQGVAAGAFYPTAATYHGAHPIGGYGFRDRFNDSTGSNTLLTSYALKASGVWVANNINGDEFQIHRMLASVIGELSATSNVFGGTTVFTAAPNLDFQDWYKFRGTASNEALLFVADTINTSTITANLDATTMYTTLSVADETKFKATGGVVIIEDEAFTYTGVSAGTLTGVTRGVYGSVKATHYSGDVCAQGLWFTIINGGAILAGYTKPA